MATKLSEYDIDRKRDVVVFDTQGDSTRQPRNFQCCPLGIQLYTHKPVDEFQVLDLRFDVNDSDNNPIEINCSGVVVRCTLDEKQDLYRLWVKFLNLPVETHSKLLEITRDEAHLCPFCENF